MNASTSRRSFLRFAGLAASAPLLSESRLAWAAMQQATPVSATKEVPRSRVFHAFPPGSVVINANENPLGPSPAALAAIAKAAASGGRYDANGLVDRLTHTAATEFDLPADHIAVYAGSSEPLSYAVLAFTSPARGYVTADPSYESGMWAANSAHAHISRVPLTSTNAHDMKAMVAADPRAGLLYVCNPNNPTGTITPREDILWAATTCPKGPY